MGGNNRGMVIQERDRHLLAELAVMRVVDREQARIAGGFNSTTRVNTRLLVLARAGLLRRFFLGAAGSGRKALYALSVRGAAEVGVSVRGPRRKNNEVLIADYFISHQLRVNQLYCLLKYGTLPHPISFERWVLFFEPLAKNLRLIPDAYFELKTPAGTMAAFLEVDLGHEGLAVWKEKIKKYLELALRGDFERRFGQEQFRVLIVANSERRLLSIRRVVRAFTQKIFWFATTEAIESNRLFAAIWIRPEGSDPQSLFPQITQPL
jgi:Replication-relaxation